MNRPFTMVYWIKLTHCSR